MRDFVLNLLNTMVLWQAISVENNIFNEYRFEEFLRIKDLTNDSNLITNHLYSLTISGCLIVDW